MFDLKELLFKNCLYKLGFCKKIDYFFASYVSPLIMSEFGLSGIIFNTIHIILMHIGIILKPNIILHIMSYGAPDFVKIIPRP
jgi:hypothetical protein